MTESDSISLAEESREIESGCELGEEGRRIDVGGRDIGERGSGSSGEGLDSRSGGGGGRGGVIRNATGYPVTEDGPGGAINVGDSSLKARSDEKCTTSLQESDTHLAETSLTLGHLEQEAESTVESGDVVEHLKVLLLASLENELDCQRGGSAKRNHALKR